MKILVCGFSGAGKTTWVKSLSCKKNFENSYSFLDLDDEICQHLKIDSNQLGNWIEQMGEIEFRRVEETILLDLLNQESSAVISLGGGALNEKILARVKSHSTTNKLIFLDEDFNACLQRIKQDKNRMLSRKSDEEIKSLYMRRINLYRQADLIISPKDANLIDGLESLVHTLSNH